MFGNVKEMSTYQIVVIGMTSICGLILFLFLAMPPQAIETAVVLLIGVYCLQEHVK
jgi:hypothetical protein